jgi:hypothetical protein
MSAYLLLIPLFTILDRWCGGGMGWRKSFAGSPIYYVVLLIPLAFHFEQYLLTEILAAWCLWRWPSWKLFGGSLAPVTSREVVGTAARHSLIAGVLVICLGPLLALQFLASALFDPRASPDRRSAAFEFLGLQASPAAWFVASALLGLWVFLATDLARYNARSASKGEDTSGFVEITRGGLFGLVTFGIIMAIELLK